jgi:hypothetical protein
MTITNITSMGGANKRRLILRFFDYSSEADSLEAWFAVHGWLSVGP